jgi:fumarate reductase iron-sulfur subunit
MPPPDTAVVAEPTLAVRVWRGGADGAFHAFEVPRRPAQSVLDVVTHVQCTLEPTLAYRFACRVGSCGSCAMTVNGQARLACRTQADAVAVDGRLEIAPLSNLPRVRDLVVDMRPFFDKWAQARGQLVPTATRRERFASVLPDSRERRAADAAIDCIGCAACHASCDVVAWRPDYLGPAALNRAWALHNDVRDGARERRLEAVMGDAGCHACHTHESCTERCPKGLSPTTSIAGLKRASLHVVLHRER